MKQITSFLKKHKVSCLLFVASLLIWGATFVTDRKVFSSDPLNMNCLPIDLQMVPFMHIASKLLLLFVVFGLLWFAKTALSHKTLLIPFVIFMAIYALGLIATYPGYFMSDDPIIYAYASRYYPVYWHCYLTSLYYMIAMSLIPASCGPVLLNGICHSIVYAYIFHEVWHLYSGKKRYAALLLGVLPFSLLGGLMCFRPALYAPFFLGYVAFFIFEHKKKASLTTAKLLAISLTTAILAIWRSEAIVLLFFVFFIVYYAYRGASKSLGKKGAFLLLLSLIVCFGVIKAPQSRGEKLFYGSDYLIISTTRPLSVIVHRDQTYEGAEEDLANISAVTEFGYLHNDSLSCSAYNRYNSDHNEGKYTETGADRETQKRYLKSAVRMILHNLDLYIGERIQLFCVTNGIFDYNQDMVLHLKPVVTTNFHLYDHDRAYGFELIDGNKRLPLVTDDDYALFWFEHGGEAYIPMLLLLGILTCLSFLKKRHLTLAFCLMMLAREAVIFLTAPASFIQYSYPVMYATAFLLLIALFDTRFFAKQTKVEDGNMIADPNE